MGDEDKSVIIPSDTYYEKKSDPDNYVIIEVDIPGIKNKIFRSEAKNADVVFTPTKTSLVLDVMLNPGEAKQQHFVYTVNCLPGFIDHEESSYEVKSDRVVLELKKLSSLSWAGQLDSQGIDLEPSK